MTVFEGILIGLQTAIEPGNLFLILLGAALGTVIGMLPGLGPAAGIAILLPFTYGMDPASAMIMLCGIYFGTMYGGSISSILINTPGDASSVMTALDGNPMAKNGRAGAALLISAVASFVGGFIGLTALTFLAIPISRWALSFGPAEYFSLMVFALLAAATLAQGHVLKGLLALALGLLVSTVGTDLQSGALRFTMGQVSLMDGVPLLAVIIGLFAVAEAFVNIEGMVAGRMEKPIQTGKLWATKAEWLRARFAMVRGAVLGFFIGVLPGAGGSVATIMAYANETRLSRHPEEFGKGAVEGVAAPEAANNASVPGALIPLLALGVPGSGTTAILLGAFLLYGLQPGPQFFTSYPDVAWGLIAGLYIAGIVLLILNVPLIGLFVRILRVPGEVFNALVLLLALTGAYSVTNSLFDVGLALVFGVLGYFMKKLGIPPAPLILGVVLGGMLEQSLRQALSLSGGDWSIFVNRPVSLLLLILASASLIWSVMEAFSVRKKLLASLQAQKSD